MPTLSRQRFEAARAFLQGNERPLEWALFRHAFEGGSVGEVLDALARHQETSGGFTDLGEGGRDGASPMATTIAFQYLTELGVGDESPMVQQGIGYFLDTFERQFEVWPPTPRPMPAYASDRLPHTWGNPSAEIVGYLLAFESLVPDAFRERVLGLALANLRHAPPPIHEFADLCFLRLARFADPELRAEILDKVGAGVLDNLQLDHARWHGGYFMKPYWFAMSPSEPLHDLLCHEIDACLDWEIETQEADGSFRLTWKIEGYGRKVWSSVWTLEVLKVLAAYGRIES